MCDAMIVTWKAHKALHEFEPDSFSMDFLWQMAVQKMIWERRPSKKFFSRWIFEDASLCDIMRISQFRTVNAKQRSSNKWLNYFHIAQFCEDNQIHFGIDDFAHPLFLSSMHFHHVFSWSDSMTPCWPIVLSGGYPHKDCRKHVFKKTNPIGIEPSCAHTTLILRSISKFPSVSGLLGWTLKQRGVVSVRNCNTCSDKRLALETMPRRKLSFQTWRREVVKFEWNEIIWRGHRRGLMSKRPLHLWCNPKFMSVRCVTQWSSHEKPAKHNVKLNQTHFQWTSCDRWRSRKWFEKGGRQRSFFSRWIFEDASLCDIMRISQFRTVNAKQRSSNKWLNYFHFAQFCEDNQIHFGIDDFAHPLFSTPCTFITYFPWQIFAWRPSHPKEVPMRSTYEGVLRIRCGEEWRDGNRFGRWNLKKFENILHNKNRKKLLMKRLNKNHLLYPFVP